MIMLLFCAMWYTQITVKEANDRQDLIFHQTSFASVQKESSMKTAAASSIQNADPIKAYHDIHNVSVTAYDLSIQSCGKQIGSHGYGVTASGYDLSNQSREEAKTIAVDPNYIPLGRKVEVIFEDEHLQKYNGIYIARDTGGAIQGHHIDIFMGDFQSEYPAEETVRFGVQKARLKVFL